MSASKLVTVPAVDYSATAKAMHLVARPDGGAPELSHFAVRESAIPRASAAGDVVVQNALMSLDPYMRGRMNAGESYIPPFPIDAPMGGGALGVVVESMNDALPVGTVVNSFSAFNEFALFSAEQAASLSPTPASLLQFGAKTLLSSMDMPARTAYVGLKAAHIGNIKKGDTVFISSAAGAVGMAAGQIARQLGAKRVVGSAGSDEKCRAVVELCGYDACINYKKPELLERMQEACPDGIDLYYDNTGGPVTANVFKLLNRFGRVALCGVISIYNSVDLKNDAIAIPYHIFLGKAINCRGFIYSQEWTPELEASFREEMPQWISNGAFKPVPVVVDGADIDGAPEAFISLFTSGGSQLGKHLVSLNAGLETAIDAAFKKE